MVKNSSKRSIFPQPHYNGGGVGTNEDPSTIVATPDVVEASNVSDKESIIILTQFHTQLSVAGADYIFAQNVPGSTINSDLILLNSQLMVDLFTNPAHVQNIHPTKKPIQVHCNNGTMATMREANFSDMPVYFNSRGITNVLSLYHLRQKFRVTYNRTDCNGVFQVHTKQGIVEFKPTPKVLHMLNLKDNPKAAFLLVNDGRHSDAAFQAPPDARWHNP
jgi:hypothetical protein